MKLNEITKILELNCDSNTEIEALNTLKDSTQKNLTFFENKKYLEDLKNTKAGAVLVNEAFKEYVPKDTIAIVTNEPYLKLALASKLFAPKPVESEGLEPIIGANCTIMPNVYIGKNTKIGDNCTIMSGAFIGDNVSIDNDTLIYPNVTIYRDCKIGNNTIIHAGTTIGSDGFGFAHTKDGKHIKIYQNGNVIIGNFVEIGANTAVDRAVFGSTIIKDGTKIDNLVQIAHNTIIDENVIIVSQVGISGSTKLGKNVIMGGQSAAVGHIEIAPFTTIAARGGVTKSLPNGSGKTYSGFPATEHKQWLKTQAKISKL